MTKNEWHIIDGFLDRLSDVMSAAGCNDFQLPDTPENRMLCTAAYPDEELRVRKGQIYCDDFTILNEIRQRLAKEYQ